MHHKIKSFYLSAVHSVSSDISSYAMNPNKDFTRIKKFPAEKILHFMVLQGSSSTRCELLDFFEMSADKPTASAFNQQRAKLKPEALAAVFYEFNSSVHSTEHRNGYRFLAADGSDFTFFSRPEFASEEYYVSEGHSANGFYSMHLNALYDLETHTYTDALIQPVHQKDEFLAFCHMADRHALLSGTKDVFIGDRGYCSYNNMAHVIEKGQYFLFRSKDINSKGIVKNFDFPNQDSFDISVNVTLVRSQKKKILIKNGFYKRYVDVNATFDYITYGSPDSYDLSFRIVRFPISDNTYECVITNLPEEEFPVERIKKLYFARWGIESSFRKLKYTIGLSNFHACKPEYIKQEIWARLIAYNVTETLINCTVIKNKNTKYVYQVNFSSAVRICRNFLRQPTEKVPIDVAALLQGELVPIRNERQYPRLQTAHFRKPRYFIYRAA